VLITKEKRNELLLELLPTIKSIAKKIYKHLPYGSVDLVELTNEGVIGALKAIDQLRKTSFDKEGKLTLQAKKYILLRAKGAIYDFLRSLDFGSKNLREKEKKLELARESLRKKLNREPTEEELAQYLGISTHELNQLEEKIGFSHILSLEEIFKQEVLGKNYENFLKIEGNVESIIEKKQLIERIKKALSNLNDKEQLVLYLLFYEGLKTTEVSHILEITPGRVTQIKNSALKKLKKELTKYV
jgi:RNA polymerase sigma factor for flagellar operon FliA